MKPLKTQLTCTKTKLPDIVVFVPNNGIIPTYTEAEKMIVDPRLGHAIYALEQSPPKVPR